ncbi:MAG: hypothetical protein ACJA13_000687 [Paraglaciecola sp.]|jgi:hypothetical protein
MKKKRTMVEVFSLSFLDVISCAFGAVVMLILLAKNGDEGDVRQSANVDDITQTVKALSQTETQLHHLEAQFQTQTARFQQADSASASASKQAQALQVDIARARRTLVQLNSQATGLEILKLRRERAAISVGSAKQRDLEVGGIPVDSDYVIFVMDTSGSMKSMWNKVLKSMEEVLNNHPQVKGFQVVSDNGEFLLPATRGRWQKDSSTRRKAILRGMRSWVGSSNSSPVEGIEAALRIYGQKTDSLALYVFGDDYSGGSYDATLASINKLNTHAQTGRKIARIHGIGFRQPRLQLNPVSIRFATLMREVALQNNGTFIAQSLE